jgi:hypothetical protein
MLKFLLTASLSPLVRLRIARDLMSMEMNLRWVLTAWSLSISESAAGMGGKEYIAHGGAERSCGME